MAAPRLIKNPPGHPLYARCNACRHSVELDLAALIELLGREATFDDLRARLRCSWCGGRKVTTITGSPWRDGR